MVTVFQIGALPVSCSDNKRENALDAASHFDDAATVFIDRFTEAGRMLPRAISSRHPDVGVSTGTSPPPVPKTKLRRSVRAFYSVYV